MRLIVDEGAEGFVEIVGDADELEGLAETVMEAIAPVHAEGQLLGIDGVAPVRVRREDPVVKNTTAESS